MKRILISRLLVGLVACGWLACLSGCDQSSKQEPASTAEQDAAKVSDVPLRIWVISPVVDAERMRRQWLADSNQPVEIQQVSDEVLHGGELPACDVIIYPARHLGDAVRRGIVTRLPSNMLAEETSGASDETSADSGLLPVEQAQVRYAGEDYGLPLGCSLPILIASNAMDAGEQRLSWPEILDQLELETPTPREIDLNTVDMAALVDRFLAIVGTLSDRNPSYGLLFEMQTMQARLKESEFLRATDILEKLSLQAGGLQAVLGSHSSAWTWACQNEVPAVVIADPLLLNAEAKGLTSGQLLAVQSDARIPGWNTGGGLIACLSSNCRQTSQAIRFIRWIREANTRASLAQTMPGIDPSIPPAGADQLSWLARQKLQNVLKNDTVPREPCLPAAHAYRKALGESLIRILSGEQTAEESLAQAERDWNAITKASEFNQRNEYENSLGLAL